MSNGEETSWDELQPEPPEPSEPVRPVSVKPAAPVVTADYPRDTPKGSALSGLSPEVRELIVTEAAAVGIRADGDLGWLLVGAQVRSWAAAQAAGAAAKSVHDSVGGIPKLILDNAVNAGRDIGATVVAAINKYRDDVIGKILTSSQTGATMIAQSTDKLTASLDAAIEKKKGEGLQLWADKAAESALHAARAATFRSIALSLLVSLILLCGVGFGGAYVEHHMLLSRLAPSQIVMGAGGANCGWATIHGEKQYICEVLPPVTTAKEGVS